jgi:hypothetical protein
MLLHKRQFGYICEVDAYLGNGRKIVQKTQY